MLFVEVLVLLPPLLLFQLHVYGNCAAASAAAAAVANGH